MEMTIKVEGLKELETALLDLATAFGPKAGVQALRPAMKAASAPVEAMIRANTPQDSGRLAASTRTRIGKPTSKMLKSEHFHKDMILAARIGWTWAGDRSLWNQSLAVEFGTSEMSGSATLRTSFDLNVDAMINEIILTLGPAIEKKASQLYKKSQK